MKNNQKIKFLKTGLPFVLVLCFSMLPYFSKGQSQFNNWYFGNLAGASFSNLPPVGLTGSSMVAQEASASISDNNGNLLFYTNGIQVWNKEHVQMPNGFGLKGNLSSTMAIIVQKPQSSNLYYIFTVDDIGGTDGLCYSVVDMSLDSGRGDVIQKNTFVFGPACEKITAVKHSNGTDIWIIAHRWTSNEFFAFRLTPSGLQTSTPVISAIGLAHTGNSLVSNGYMKASPLGTKIAVAITGLGKCELFTFNQASGTLSNCQSLSVSSAYGVEFSFEERYLYVSERYLGNIVRFDLQANPISLSKITVGSFNNYLAGALQLGKDHKIYVAHPGSSFLGIIEDPDNVNSTFTVNGLSLIGRENYEGLPTFLSSIFFHSCYGILGECEGDSTHFILYNTSQMDSVFWNLDYPSVDPSDHSDDFNPSFLYTQGMYTIQLIAWYSNGYTDTTYRQLFIHPLPELNLPSDTSICYYQCIDAGPGFFQYIWTPGLSFRYLCPATSGMYTIEVFDQYGCSSKDSINVTVWERPDLTSSVTNVTTVGGSDGAIDISPYGGLPPYTYNWSNSQNTQDISGLPIGCYNISLMDSRNCSNYKTICVSGPPTTSCAELKLENEWSKVIANAIVEDIIADENHNTYIAGSFSGLLQLDTFSINSSGYKFFLAKYNEWGKLLWVTTSQGSGTHYLETITLDEDGNIWVGGYFTGQCEFNTSYSFLASSSDGFVAKYDSEGDFITALHIGGSSNQSINSLSAASDNSVYAIGAFKDSATVQGYTANSIGMQDVLLMKISLSGNILWIKSYGGDGSDSPINIRSSSDGGVCMGLFFGGLLYADSLDYQSFGSYDIFLAAFDGGGNMKWGKSFGTIYTESNIDFVVDTGDNISMIFKVGGGNQFVCFSDTNETLPTASSYLTMMVEFDDQGKLLWVRYLNTFYPSSLERDDQDNIVVMAMFGNPISFDGITTLVSSGSNESLLAVFNTFGIYQWAKTSTCASYDYCYRGTSYNNSYVISGTFANSTFSFGDTILAPVSSTNYYLSKLTPSLFRFNYLNVTGLDCNVDSICAELDIIGGTKPYSYHWSNGYTGSSFCEVPAGSYYLYVVDSLGCLIDTFFTISPPANFNVDLQPLHVSSHGGSDGQVLSFINGGQGPYIYNWSNSSVTEDLIDVPAGQYSVTVTDSYECTAVASATVTQPETPMFLTFIVNQPTCSGDGADGNIHPVVDGGIGPYSYHWSTGGTNQNILHVPPGWYYLTVTDNSVVPLMVIDSVFLELDVPLNVDLGPDTVVCGSTYIFLDAGVGGTTYNWSTGAETQTISVNTPGLYSVAVVNTCGVFTDSILISTDTTNLLPNLGPDTSLCSGPLLLCAGSGGAIYQWSNGSSDSSIIINSSGLYSVSVTNCTGQYADSILVTMYPEYNILNPVSICSGSSYTINGHTYIEQGIYWDNFITQTGCDSIFETHLNVINVEIVDSDIAICQGDSAWLSGSWQHSAGVYVDTMISVAGCDSIIVSHLAVNEIQTTYNYVNYCKDDSVLYNGTWYSSPTIVTDTIPGLNSCDSVIVCDIAENPVPLTYLGTDTVIHDDEQLVLDAGCCYESYFWSTAQTSQFIVVDGSVLGAGVYDFSVIVSDSNYCSSTDTVIVTVTVAQLSLTQGNNDVQVFPNPATEVVNVLFTEKKADFEWSLNSELGIELLSGIGKNGKAQILLSHISPGVYILEVSSEGKCNYFNVVKN